MATVQCTCVARVSPRGQRPIVLHCIIVRSFVRKTSCRQTVPSTRLSGVPVVCSCVSCPRGRDLVAPMSLCFKCFLPSSWVHARRRLHSQSSRPWLW